MKLPSITEKDLVKDTGEASPKTVVLVGNGALVNGWEPLRSVLDHWIDEIPTSHEVIKKLRTQNTEALNQLANLSYRFKIARGLIYKQWWAKSMTPAQTEKAGLGSSLQDFLLMREKVAREYQHSSPGLCLKKDERVEEIIGPNAVFITTNWDNALWKDERVKKAVYLHGRCEFPDSLVFPTELIIEDIAFDCNNLENWVKDRSRAFAETILRTFRCGTVEALLDAHATASRLIRQADRLIIWGYSLGTFDADINALIGINMDRRDGRELIVINTDPFAFHRALALTGITKASFYDPGMRGLLCLKA